MTGRDPGALRASLGVRGRGQDDRGSASTEMVLVMPILIVFLSLVVLSGRLTDARGDVVSAASDAARAASLGRTQGEAVAEAQAIAEASVAGEGIDCDGGIQVNVAFEPAFERGATVHTTVTCDVPTGDLALMNLPGVITVQQEAWEPRDQYASE